MKKSVRSLAQFGCLWVLGLAVTMIAGCSGSTSGSLTGPPVYVLSVTSIANIHEQITAISPADNNKISSGTTGLSLQYNPGTKVTLTAAASDLSGPFLGWCDASSTNSSPFKCAPAPCTSVSGLVCNITMSANFNLLATYPGVTGVTITPISATATLPNTTQFTATVSGLGTYGNNLPYQGSPYMFTLAGPSGYSGGLGTITATGLYTPPYPAPPTVTVTALSTVLPSAANLATLTLNSPAAAPGPPLTVDAGTVTRPISPLIYGMNSAGLDSSIPAFINLPIDRWGGTFATRYNYLIDSSNSAAPGYFENTAPAMPTGFPIMSQFNTQVMNDKKTKTATLATMPLTGYVTSSASGCSFSVKKYGAQTATDPNSADCGNGILATAVNGSTAVMNDPNDTSMAIDQTFVGGWVKFLDTQFSPAANGGVGFYGLGNEPENWNSIHKDVHPKPFTYDELSSKGIAYAAAIKAQDPGALVTGPVIANWLQYFYSAQDVANGLAATPSCPTANPTDRLAHANTPLIEYYLKQFANYQTANKTRLLDYVDLHTFFAAQGAASALTGDTSLQQARLNSTRVFWDPTYTDPNYTDPSNTTCTGKAFPPNLINLMKGWVATDYPGTKLAITAYNWGGQEAINGALAQADILGIFGREGVDLSTLSGVPAPVMSVQQPGVIAFKAFTNYDGNNGHFGESAVTSTSANQGVLAVYGANRAADNTLTVVVINKGYGDLNTVLSLPNLKTTQTAKSYLYSASNLSTIVTQSNATVTAPASAGGPSTLSTLFPAQSITILIIPRS